MKFINILAGSLALATSLAASGNGYAACIGSYLCYDNISSPSSGSALVTSTGLYDSFTTGLSQQIYEIDLLLDGSSSIEIKLFDNNGNNTPGVSFYDEILSGSGMPLEYYPTNPPLVQADTRYWIGLFPTGSTYWSYSSDLSANGVAGEYWADSGGVYPNSMGHGPFQMDLGDGAIIVPEPASWALALVGFIGLGLAGLRRRTGPRPIGA